MPVALEAAIISSIALSSAFRRPSGSEPSIGFVSSALNTSSVGDATGGPTYLCGASQRAGGRDCAAPVISGSAASERHTTVVRNERRTGTRGKTLMAADRFWLSDERVGASMGADRKGSAPVA